MPAHLNIILKHSLLYDRSFNVYDYAKTTSNIEITPNSLPSNQCKYFSHFPRVERGHLPKYDNTLHENTLILIQKFSHFVCRSVASLSHTYKARHKLYRFQKKNQTLAPTLKEIGPTRNINIYPQKTNLATITSQQDTTFSGCSPQNKTL